MQTSRPLTAFRRSPVIVLVGASERRRPRPAVALLRRALAMLDSAPAPTLTVFAAGLAGGLVWGGYYAPAMTILPALGLYLAIRGTKQAGGWPALAMLLATVVALGLVSMLWR